MQHQKKGEAEAAITLPKPFTLNSEGFLGRLFYFLFLLFSVLFKQKVMEYPNRFQVKLNFIMSTNLRKQVKHRQPSKRPQSSSSRVSSQHESSGSDFIRKEKAIKEKQHFPSSNVIIFMLPPPEVSDDIFTHREIDFLS